MHLLGTLAFIYSRFQPSNASRDPDVYSLVGRKPDFPDAPALVSLCLDGLQISDVTLEGQGFEVGDCNVLRTRHCAATGGREFSPIYHCADFAVNSASANVGGLELPSEGTPSELENLNTRYPRQLCASFERPFIRGLGRLIYNEPVHEKCLTAALKLRYRRRRSFPPGANHCALRVH